MNGNEEKIQIRNSTVDFLVFTKQNSEEDVYKRQVQRIPVYCPFDV